MDCYRLYSDLPLDTDNHAVAQINLQNLAHNYRVLCGVTDALYDKADTKPCRKICVVKADAYGHGATHCAEVLYREGCDFFAVSSLAEAVSLRRYFCEKHAGERHPDILVLGYTNPTYAAANAKYSITYTVFSEESAVSLNEAAKRAGVDIPVHIKLDTGMNRLGFPTDSDKARECSADFLRALSAGNCAGEYSNLDIRGIFTHFAKAESDPAATMQQFDRFSQTVALAQVSGPDSDAFSPLIHICNSAAATKYPICFADAVRYGIMLYGCSVPKDASGAPIYPLLPVMKLTTTVAHIHTLSVGECVGYGGEYSSDTPRTIATLPVGYADGILRACRGAYVTLKHAGKALRVPIVGRVCMDQLMVDATGTGAEVGDETVIFGETVGDTEEFATAGGTIDYECLCAVSSRVMRIYI